MAAEPPAAPPEGKFLGWLTAVKGLTISNVLVIAMLAIVAVPIYVIYRALGDDKLLDRFLSTYEEETSQQVGCALRHAQQRGGPEVWSVSTGFAFIGADRYYVNVAINHAPDNDELMSYCQALKLISDKLLANEP